MTVDERIPKTGVVQPQFCHLPLKPSILGFEIIQAGTFLSLVCGRSGSPPVEGARRNTILLTDHLDRGVSPRSKDPLSLIVGELGTFSGFELHSENPTEALPERGSDGVRR